MVSDSSVFVAAVVRYNDAVQKVVEAALKWQADGSPRYDAPGTLDALSEATDMLADAWRVLRELRRG